MVSLHWYVCIYIYPSHFNSLGAVSVVLSPDYEPRSTGLTTRRSRRDCARVEVGGPGPRGIGLTRRRLMCEKDCARAEMEWASGLSVVVLESKNENKETLHQKRVRQRRKSLTD